MKNKLKKIILLIKMIVQSVIYRKKIYIAQIPIHGNLGDQAIIYAECKLFNDVYPKRKIIEIESSIIRNFPLIVKHIVKNNQIFVHGGGFLGNLWINEEEVFRKILKIFPNNRIIVLPQTIYFTNDLEGKEQYEKSKEIYESHKNLTFILRERYSYEYMEKNFPKCDIKLAPDMVLYLNKNDFEISNNLNEKLVIFCTRNDKEKIISNYDDVIDELKKMGYDNIKYTDTVINKNIYKDKRKNVLSKKINEFAGAGLIVTDRLHGMIFALISGTPCLVFQNKSYKIIGVYEWIKNIKSVKIHDNNLAFKDEIIELLNHRQEYDNKNLKDELKNMI